MLAALRTATRRAPALVGRRQMSAGFYDRNHFASAQEEAASNAAAVEQLKTNKANLQATMAGLKKGAKSTKGSPEISISSWDAKSGALRVNPMYIKTPWDSVGLDGGSPADLLARYELDVKEMDAEIARMQGKK